MPRTYEGHSHWDLGFLFLRSDRICYWGEETRFALRRDQITPIKLGPGMPSLLRWHRVYIAWRDMERSTCGVFSLACATPEARLSLSARTKGLFGQLLIWHATPAGARPPPEPLDCLSSPQFGSVTGISPLTLRKRILKQMYLFGLLAAAVAVVAGLPFHLFDSLLQGQSLPGAHPDSVGPGWYVVTVTLGVIFLQYIPYFFYKEVPVLQADLGPAAAPIRSLENKQHTRETETVSS